MYDYETMLSMDELGAAFYGQEFVEIPRGSTSLLDAARDMERQGFIEFVAKTKAGYIFRSMVA